MIMKKYALLYSILAAAGGIGMLSAEGGGKVIDLNKPVGDSLVPDGFYWTFDDGIAGESEPLIVQDHSGNSFDGHISSAGGSPTPTYADGVFGTAIYVQGNPQVTWRKGHKLDAAPDPSKLTMKGQAFTGGVWFKMDDRKPAAHVLIRRDDNTIGWRLMVLKDQEADKESDGASWYLNLEYGDSRIRGTSLASTPVFADGKWHHVGFSVSPGPDEGQFTTVFWIDGEIFDTVAFKATVPDPKPEYRFLSVGNGVWGLLDDAFVTTGVHSFKK